MSSYEIAAGGGNTATPLNVSKRLELISRYLVPKESRVLDGGCGEGDYVVALRRRYYVEAWGIEYAQGKVRAFGSKHPQLDWVCGGDLENLPFGKGTFDLAILNEVLEHVPDDVAALTEIHRVLKPGGVAIILSPNRLFPFESHGVSIRCSEIRLPPWVPFIPYIPLRIGQKILRYWARNYWPLELRDLIAAAGFDILQTSYLWQTFENISGSQPAFIRRSRFLLRRVAGVMEDIPLLKTLGVSQVVVAQK